MTANSLPANWSMEKLSTCCEIISGATPKRNVEKYWDGDIPWVTPKDLSNLDTPVLDCPPEFITKEGLESCSSRLLPKGSILFSSRAPIGLTAIAGRKMCTNQGFKSLVPGDGVDSGYLYRCMKWMSSKIAKMGNGATFKEVSKEVVSRVEIPLPPLPEQRRIAAILDKADAIRRKRQQAICLTEDFLRSAFLDMFGDPVTNPKGWPQQTIGSVLHSIDSGWSANGEDRIRQPEEWAVLKISSVTSGRFIPSEYKVVPAESIARDLITPKRGDLLFSRANTRELVAATCLVEKDEPKLFLPDKLWRITPDKNLACSEYLKYLLSHARFRENFTKQATGTSGSMLNVSMAKLRGLEIPLPPIRVQMEFAKLVWKSLDLQAKVKSSEYELGTLFNSLAQRAFRGDF